MSLPLINIITRTSGRPLFFGECQQSIQLQTYDNNLIHRYVTFDEETDLQGYIEKYNNLIVLEMEREKRKNPSHFPYHAYLNDVAKYIVDNEDDVGWIMILDDDNLLAKSTSLDILGHKILEDGCDPNKFYIWKCESEGRIIPSELNFGKVPKAGDVHISGFAFHQSHVALAHFECKRGAESDVINHLFNRLTCVWINEVLTQAPTHGNGTREDKKETKKKLSLKSTPSSLAGTAPVIVNVSSHVVDADDAVSSKDGQIFTSEEPKVTDEEEEEIGNEEDRDLDAVDEVEIGRPKENQVIDFSPPLPPASGPKVVVATETPPGSNCGPVIVSSTPNPQLSQVNRLIQLLESGKPIYILDEHNMHQLSSIIAESVGRLALTDQLTKYVTNIDSGETKKSGDVKSGPQPKNETLPKALKAALASSTGPASKISIDKIYLLTHDRSPKNAILERNKKIIERCGHDYAIVTCKDMNIYVYQNQIKELLTEAKNQKYASIMILNGNDLLHEHFGDLLKKQVDKIHNDCHLWFLGLAKETPAREILSTKFNLDDYLFLYNDIVNAKLTTEEKAKIHWKTYGHREGRYASIEVLNNTGQVINNTYGFVIASPIYDAAIDLINQQNHRDCKNVLVELQSNCLDIKYVWYSRPDLIIPAFNNPTNHKKNSELAVRNGWYYNFYH